MNRYNEDAPVTVWLSEECAARMGLPTSLALEEHMVSEGGVSGFWNGVYYFFPWGMSALGITQGART